MEVITYLWIMISREVLPLKSVNARTVSLQIYLHNALSDIKFHDFQLKMETKKYVTAYLRHGIDGYTV